MHARHVPLWNRMLFALVVPAYLIGLGLFPHVTGARPLQGTCPSGVKAIGAKPTDVFVKDYVGKTPLPHNINSKATINATSIYVHQVTLGLLQEELVQVTQSACPASTPVWYVAFTATGGSFEFLGPHGVIASYAAGFEVFLDSTGNLILLGGNSAIKQL
jgi:hypothetical protein